MRTMQTIRCLKCEHEDQSEAPLESIVCRCNECGARMAYGELQPRIVLERDDTGRFVVIRFSVGNHSTEFKLDAQHAASVAVNMLSLMVVKE